MVSTCWLSDILSLEGSLLASAWLEGVGEGGCGVAGGSGGCSPCSGETPPAFVGGERFEGEGEEEEAAPDRAEWYSLEWLDGAREEGHCLSVNILLCTRKWRERDDGWCCG